MANNHSNQLSDQMDEVEKRIALLQASVMEEDDGHTNSDGACFETPDVSAAPTPLPITVHLPPTHPGPPLAATSSSSTSSSSKDPSRVLDRKKRHFGSVTDLTPEGILTEEGSSSDDDDDDGNGNGRKARSAAKRKAKSAPSTSATEGGGADDEKSEDKSEVEKKEHMAPSAIQERNLVQDILTELGTSPAPAAHTMVVPVDVPLPIKRTPSQVQKSRHPRTKIVCAIGPACQSQKVLGDLLDAGMNVARLNFSHGDHEYHATSVRNLRAAIEERRAKGINCRCAILLDTKGPEIRTGKLEGGKSLKLEPGQLIEFSGMDYDVPGNERIIKCSYENLAEDLKPGGKILIADGELCLEVLICKPERKSVLCRVQNYFTLGEKKNVNLPGVAVRLPGITDRDRFDIANFALVHNVDIISGSFTRTAANVRALRECLKGAKIRVHAKIESVEALAHLDEIIAEADGVHVSRGDLGMELPLSKLPLVQKAIIHAANVAGKPVVTSTQLLQSMVENPRPTNAECTDVANACLDGTDCVMLSAETANGKYPAKAVQTMSRILVQAERLINWESTYDDVRAETLHLKGSVPLIEAICSTAVETAIELRSRLIVVASDSGMMGLFVAKYRPRARILVVTEKELVANQMSVSRGVEAIVVPSIRNLDIVWESVCNDLLTKEQYRLPENHPVVLVDSPPATYDTRFELSKEQNEGVARWNMVRVMRVPAFEDDD